MCASASILLTDDEPSFLASTAQLLRNDGYLCDAAADAYQGVRLLNARRYDLMIADIRMPGNRDLELVKFAHESVPGMPVILVTGYPSADTAISSIHLPVTAYLTKPLSYSELRPYLHESLVQSRSYRIVRGVEAELRKCADRLADLCPACCDTMSPTRAPEAGPRLRPNDRQRVPDPLLRALAGCISQLIALEKPSRAKELSTTACRLIGCPAWKQGRGVIRKAVTLLQETKRRFKSKELAEVRTMLEELLEEFD